VTECSNNCSIRDTPRQFLLPRKVAEPQGDGGEVDLALEEVHGRRMPKRMNAHLLGCEGGAGGSGNFGVFDDKLADGVAAERGSGGAGKEGVLGASATFGKPHSHDGDGLFAEGSDSLLSAFAGDPHVGSMTNGAPPQPDKSVWW
jgi:hypothetical protein